MARTPGPAGVGHAAWLRAPSDGGEQTGRRKPTCQGSYGAAGLHGISPEGMDGVFTRCGGQGSLSGSFVVFLCFSLWMSLNLIKNHVVHSLEENQRDPSVKPCGIQAQFKQK